MAKQLNVQLSGLDLASIDNKDNSRPNHISRFNDESLAVILYDEIPSDLIEQYAFLVNATLEGCVENEKIANILKQYGCEIAQGYYFGKPMPFADYFQWLQRYKQTG